MLVYLDLSKDSLDGVVLASRITDDFIASYCKKLLIGERFQIFHIYNYFAPNKWIIFTVKNVLGNTTVYNFCILPTRRVTNVKYTGMYRVNEHHCHPLNLIII